MDNYLKMISGQMTEDELETYLTITSHKTICKLMKQHKGKDYHYMITFTIDPKRHDVKSEELHKEIQNYITKRTKMLKVQQAYIVQEGGDEEEKHTHWHVSLLSKKPIKGNRFAYYKIKYGNYDYSPSKNGNNEEALNYMSKQTEPVLIT